MTAIRRPLVLLIIAAALLGLLALPVVAGATEQAKLHVSFQPDHLGKSTTIHFDIALTTRPGEIPTPITDISIALPVGMGLGTTDLGEDTCNPTQLIERSLLGCSPNSQMGHGKAIVGLPVGGQVIENEAEITIFMAKPEHETTSMMFYADTHYPVAEEEIFMSQLLPQSKGPFGASLNTVLPIIEPWPEASDTAILRLESTLGPSGLTYYEWAHGKEVGYTPTGMDVPETCPRHGFPFAATFTFKSGASISTATTVPCPRVPKRGHKGQRK